MLDGKEMLKSSRTLLGLKKSYFKLLNGEQKQGLSAVRKLNQNFVWLVGDFLFIFKDCKG